MFVIKNWNVDMYCEKYLHTHIHANNYSSTNTTVHEYNPKSYLKSNPYPIPKSV